MSDQVGKKSPKRTKPTFVYSIISNTMVLYMIGLLGLIILHLNKLSDNYKENIEIAVRLKDNTKEADYLRLLKMFETEPFTKSAKYISKERALEILKETTDDYDVDLLGYNPLYASINLFLNAAYVNPDSMDMIVMNISMHTEVQDVYYSVPVVNFLSTGVRTIGLVIIGLGLLFFIISITLINNTIRLSMYSNRFLVKSMQLVGASRSFIKRPFILKGIYNGFLSGALAIGFLIVTLYYARQEMEDLAMLTDLPAFTILFVGVIFTGIFISWLSTWIVVGKYLRMKLDDLY